MLSYLRFALVPCLFLPLTALTTLLGGGWIGVSMLCVTLSYVFFDNVMKHDTADHHYRLPVLLALIPYLQLPAAALALFAVIWQAAPGDLLGFGAWLSALTDHNIMALHDLAMPELLLAAVSTGYTMSTNTVVAHELIHKTHSPLAMIAGRWLLALVGDAQFSISHVYSHHPNVATPADGATARRGESVYRFFIRSSLAQYAESWQVETQRLSLLKSRSVLLANRVTRGVLMSLLVVTACVMAAGVRGGLACLVVMLVSKFLFETVNYIQHYGLVRVPGTHVEPRHSWDCHNQASSAGLLNLTRHSDHHTHPRREYWKLQAHSYAVGIEKGYVAHIFYALIPPMWFKRMEAKLAYWDEHIATDAERALIRQSGLPAGNSNVPCVSGESHE
ncbi:fatty acid desaturase [Enterobacter cloacae]|uniref:fatty acid desaturase n=1 Tax=Enterobacter cloacae TaxID=550 RepID=UPI003570A55A